MMKKRKLPVMNFIAGRKFFRRLLLLAAGHLLLVLGLAGVFLPVLPTTPFLILAAFCYLKSSEKLYLRLINNRVVGRYIQSYIQFRAISVRAKLVSIIALCSVISITAIFFIDPAWLRALLFLIAAGVSLFLLKMKTLTVEMLDEIPEPGAQDNLILQ